MGIYCCLYCLCKDLPSVSTSSTRTNGFSPCSMHRDGGWAVCSWWTSSEAVQLWEEALGSLDELAACHHVPLLWHLRAGGHRGTWDQRAASGHGQDDAFLSSLYWRSDFLSLQGCTLILCMGVDHWSGNLRSAFQNDSLGAGCFTPWNTSKRSQKDQSGPPYTAQIMTLHCRGASLLSHLAQTAAEMLWK